MRPFKDIREAFPELPYKAHYLPDNEYCKEVTSKFDGLFVLHCTNGSSMKYLGGVGGIWDSDQLGPIATMFGVEKDGLLYQYFDEDYWAFGTGCGELYDRRTVQVEMGNRAGVILRNGKYYWNPDGRWSTPYDGTPVKALFNGIQYWDSYPDAQVDTVAKLTAYICYNHGIPLKMEFDINFKGASYNQKGILTHSHISNVRSDPGPAFPYKQYWELTQKYFYQLCNEHGYPVYGKRG